MSDRKLNMGMVGGGGGFIGNVHRMAAMLDNQAVLTAGAFSSNPQKSLKFGGNSSWIPPGSTATTAQ